MVTLTIKPISSTLPSSAAPTWHFSGPSNNSDAVFTQAPTSIRSGYQNPQGHDVATISWSGLAITGGAIGGDDTQPYVFNGTVSNLRLDVYDNSTDRGYDETITGVNIPLSSLLGNGVSGGHYFITTLSISDIQSGNARVQDILTDSFQGNKLTVSLFGYDGNDTLVGGAAQDTYVGGSGSDTFMPGAYTGTNDTVLDFTPGVDRIDFTGVRMTLAGAFLNATLVGFVFVFFLLVFGFFVVG